MEVTTNCTGCGLCGVLCPKNAIQIANDSHGFLRPVIDESKCISCHLCQKQCPQNNPVNLRSGDPEVFCYRLTEENQRAKSQSGGAFYALASQIIADGGIVYGVGMADPYHAETMRVDSIAGLEALRKSKYIQSDTGKAYRQVREDLQAGRVVLYSGTACQVAGLEALFAYYHLDSSRLFTLDIICHGVPSPLIHKEWGHYLEKKHHSSLAKMTFRDKSFGWHSGVPTYEFANGNQDHDTSYYVLFVTNLILNPCCYECKYANVHRDSDITIGDFWGIETTEFSARDDNKGTSVLFIRNPQLLSYFSQTALRLKNQGFRQYNLEQPSSKPSGFNHFWSLHAKHPLFAIKKYGHYYQRWLKHLFKKN